jgi:predicted transporter
MDNVKKAVRASNPAVRNAAMNLIGTLYLYLGSQLFVFFEDEKLQVQQQIQMQFDKVKFITYFVMGCILLRHVFNQLLSSRAMQKLNLRCCFSFVDVL